jgi:hypothetical protein
MTNIFDTLFDIAQSLEKASRQLEAVTAALAADPEVDTMIVCRHFDKVNSLWEIFNDVKKRYNSIYDKMSQETIPDTFRRDGIKHIFIEGVGRIGLSRRFSCSMLDKDAGFKWLEETGNGSLIQRTVNAQTLASFAKTRLEEEGIDLPAGIFKTSIMTYSSITKR